MIAEFERMAGDLEREIKVEQDRAGIHDPGHFAYPTYAKAAINRRENLKRSADELRVQLEDAKLRSARRSKTSRRLNCSTSAIRPANARPINAAEQADLDGIALMRARGSAPA